jgi:hypothetical protein
MSVLTRLGLLVTASARDTLHTHSSVSTGPTTCWIGRARLLRVSRKVTRAT